MVGVGNCLISCMHCLFGTFFSALVELDGHGQKCSDVGKPLHVKLSAVVFTLAV